MATWLKIHLPTCSRRIPITPIIIMSLVFLSSRWLAASLVAGHLFGPGAGADPLGLSPALKEKSSFMSHMSSLHQLGPCWFPAFRLGSGALCSAPGPKEKNTEAPVTLGTLKYHTQKLTPGKTHKEGKKKLPIVRSMVEGISLKPLLYLMGLSTVSIILFMMPAGGGMPNMVGRDFNYRVPPYWSPELEHQYSFRAYMTDISLWVLLTDLLPHQQCAAIIMKLGGAAREMARMITPQEMVQGGMRNGVHVDPVTYLLGAIHARFAALEEESRLTTVMEMTNFHRKPGETINALLARYETVRQRAAVEGQFQMSLEGCALQLLRAVGVSPQQLIMLLQPFQGRLPANDQEFQVLVTQLRRYGHIQEGARGNIGQIVQNSVGQARPGHYLTGQDQEDTMEAFFEGSQQPTTMTGSASQDPYSVWGQGAYPAISEGHQPEAGGSYGTDGFIPAYDGSDYTQAFPSIEEEDGTDSETSSDDGGEIIQDTSIDGLGEAEIGERLFMAYRRARRQWRRYTGKPVRRFRRTIKHMKKWRKGRGKGFFWTGQDTEAYLNHKGKGHRKHTSGKGHGRKGNPKDKHGNKMLCKGCDSDQHFIKDCPNPWKQQKGGGKGGSQPTQGFMGLTYSESSCPPEERGNTFHASNSSGRHQPDAAASSYSPPWEEGDLVFEAPSQIFTSFQQEDEIPPPPQPDPFTANDPWNYGPRRSPRGRRTPMGDAWANFMPTNSPTWPGTGRVTQDDELSQSSQEPTPQTPPTQPTTTVPQTGPATGFTTPLPTNPLNYVGLAPEVPLERREGLPNITENQIANVLASQQLTNPSRTREANTFRPHLIRHQLPISTAFSRSAAGTNSVVLDTGAHPTETGSVSFNNVQQAVTLATQLRSARHNNTSQAQAASSSTASDAAMPEASPAPASPLIGSTIGGGTPPPELVASDPPTPSEAPQGMPVPIIWEGLDDACSICTHNFTHGERVCRLSCRHMFHSTCWNDMFDHANSRRQASICCPNCRGAGSVIAVWNYIDENRVTQQVGGLPQAPNLLTANTRFHQIGTPPDGRMPTPFIPVPTPNGVIESVFQDLNPLNNPLSNQTSQSSNGRHQSEIGTGEPVAYSNGQFFVQHCYHIQTQLPDGRKSLLIDPGSVGNLCGDKWAKEMAKEAARNKRKPTHHKRNRPLRVGGVGNGTQVCAYDCTLPIAFRQDNSNNSTEGKINIPTVNNSDLPGLLGLTALRKNRAILDLNTLKLHFLGPGDYDLASALPPGTDTFQGEIAPSGHLVIPCAEFGPKEPSEESSLTLITKPPGLEPTRGNKRSRVVPPPPEASPPMMPAVYTPTGPPQGPPGQTNQ